jgi:MFS family permease
MWSIGITAFALFEVGAALAKNIETYLICRFFAALFGCPPLTTFGGSISDMWSPLARTFVFPIISVPTFMFPVQHFLPLQFCLAADASVQFLSPTVADFIATSPLVSWHWTDWLTAILAGAVITSITLFVPETYPPVLLSWKAAHLRSVTGDERYRAAHELKPLNLGIRLLRSVARPIQFLLTEPIVDLFSLYLVIVYIILFGFLPGFDFIFGERGIYKFDQRHRGLCFLGINVGFLFALTPIQPLYQRFKRKLHSAKEAGVDKVEAEERLWFAMLGAPCMTISIFWMAWSSWASVSFWSPIVATVLFGFGTLGVFISSYQYIIDTFEVYAASALVGMTVTRYCVAGECSKATRLRWIVCG